MEQIYTPKQDYKVLVRCFTYNHSKYIEDALNGFAMQKTNFPFACLVMDDCSTDGEQEVIKAWMERECDMEKAEYIEIELSNIILAPHKSNTNCTLAFYFLKQNLYGTGNKKMKMVCPWREHCEYEALCEGDDYWTDSTKLQKQYDFLETHKDYTLCFHKVKTKSEKGRKHHDYFDHLETREYTVEEMLKRWTVPTGSMMIRKDMLDKFPTHPKFTYGDNVMVLTCLQYGKMFCFGAYMGVYRLSESGWTGQSIVFNCQRQISHIEGLIEVFDSCKNDIMVNNLKNEYCKMYYHLFSQFSFQECISVKTELKEKFGEMDLFGLNVRAVLYSFKYYVKIILKKVGII